MRRDESWLWAERRLREALAPQLRAARSDGLERFWFIRKQPALRLRFGGRDLPSPMVQRMQSTLATLQRQGVVSHAVPGVYEPETRLFGGPAGMDVVHRYFDLDTAAWMALAEAEDRAPLGFTRVVLSLAAMVDLLRRCLEGQTEVWDTWSNLHHVYGPPATPLEAPAIDLRALGARAPARARSILSRYEHANATLAAGLRALVREGRLAVGLRGLLPTIVGFHWNRHLLDGPTMARLSAAMVEAPDPRRGLVGVAPQEGPSA